MGLGFNLFCLTWSPLTTVAIFQTTKNSLSCQLSYFHVILTSMSVSGVNKTVADVIRRVGTKLDQVFKHPRRPRDSGGEGKSKRAEKYGTEKSKERREEPLGTMSYQTSSKRLPPFCLLIG